MSEKRKMLWIQVILIMMIVLLYLLIHSGFIEGMPKCWLREKTGILCPTCGGTRCVVALLEGDLRMSFHYHPIFLITILYFILIDIVYVINTVTGKKMDSKFYPKWYWIIPWGILLTLYTIYRNIF